MQSKCIKPARSKSQRAYKTPNSKPADSGSLYPIRNCIPPSLTTQGRHRIIPRTDHRMAFLLQRRDRPKRLRASGIGVLSTCSLGVRRYNYRQAAEACEKCRSRLGREGASREGMSLRGSCNTELVNTPGKLWNTDLGATAIVVCDSVIE